MRCKIIAILGSLAVVCSAGTGTVWAQDPIHKASRGVVNLLTGWIELPRQVDLGRQEDNPVTGIGWGLVKGAGLCVLRSGIGLYEFLTFPIPYPREFASPYEQLEMTDYAWE